MTLLHIVHAWDEARDSDHAKLRDPIKPSLMNGAEHLKKEFVRLLGRDLTVQKQNPLNPFWHTGFPSVRCGTGWARWARDRSTADIYSGLPQQTSADPTPGYMHASQGAPNQCYIRRRVLSGNPVRFMFRYIQ